MMRELLLNVTFATITTIIFMIIVWFTMDKPNHD